MRVLRPIQKPEPPRPNIRVWVEPLGRIAEKDVEDLFNRHYDGDPAAMAQKLTKARNLLDRSRSPLEFFAMLQGLLSRD
jgi:hypothetical protein